MIQRRTIRSNRSDRPSTGPSPSVTRKKSPVTSRQPDRVDVPQAIATTNSSESSLSTTEFTDDPSNDLAKSIQTSILSQDPSLTIENIRKRLESKSFKEPSRQQRVDSWIHERFGDAFRVSRPDLTSDSTAINSSSTQRDPAKRFEKPPLAPSSKLPRPASNSSSLSVVNLDNTNPMDAWSVSSEKPSTLSPGSSELRNYPSKEEQLVRKESSILTLADVSLEAFDDSDVSLIKGDLQPSSTDDSLIIHLNKSIGLQKESPPKCMTDDWTQMANGGTHSIAIETEAEPIASRREIGILTEPLSTLEVISTATETMRLVTHSICTETDPEPVKPTRSILIETDSFFHINRLDVLTQTETEVIFNHHKEIQAEPVKTSSKCQMTEAQLGPHTLTSSTQTLHSQRKHQETYTIQKSEVSESVQTVKWDGKSLGVDTSDLWTIQRCQRLVLPDDMDSFLDLHDLQDPYIQYLSEKLKSLI